MDLREHPWNVSTEEARAIQENLRKLRDIPLPTELLTTLPPKSKESSYAASYAKNESGPEKFQSANRRGRCV